MSHSEHTTKAADESTDPENNHDSGTDAVESQQVQIGFWIEEVAREAANDNSKYGELSRALRERTYEIAFGDDTPAEVIRARLGRRKDDLEDINEKARKLAEERSEAVEDIERLEEHLAIAESWDAESDTAGGESR